MDNICHTLAGAALARTGLRNRTAFASATMMIGANLPDIDILSAFAGRTTEFRRGWTHGILALIVLPFVLAGIMMLWARYRRNDLIVPKQLLLLSAISIWSHPTLDWMNSYGMRWLMPFDGTWFYGDSLFIIDPYLLVVLGLGVWLSRRRELAGSDHPWRPARMAVGIASAYIVSMLGLHQVAKSIAVRELADTGRAKEKLVVAPAPANPFKWRVHADDGARYSTGNVHLLSGRLTLDPTTLDKGLAHPAIASAMADESARPFLDWARLPFYRIEQTSSGTRVRIVDARYGASIVVPANQQQ